MTPLSTPKPFWCAESLSRVWLSVTPWTVARQAPLSVGFSRQEYWSGLPFPSPGDLFYPGIEAMPLASPASATRFFTTVPIGKTILFSGHPFSLHSRWGFHGFSEGTRWHHWLNGHEFEQALGVVDRQGSLVCCSSWGSRESDTTERQNWTEPDQNVKLSEIRKQSYTHRIMFVISRKFQLCNRFLFLEHSFLVTNKRGW